LSAFLCVMLLVTSIHEGFVTLFLTGRWPELNLRLDHSALLISMTASILFTRSFLATAKTYPALDVIYRICQWLTALLAFVNLLHPLGSVVVQPVFWGMVLVFLAATIVASMSVSDRAIRFFVAGWSILFVSYVIFQLSQIGLL